MKYNFTKISTHAHLFNLLEKCRGVDQHKVCHPEGDVFNHQLQCLAIALKESNDIDLVVAAMLHDCGKMIDPRGHEKWSGEMLYGHVSDKTLWLVSNHMRFWKYINGEMRKYQKTVDFANHKWLSDLAQVCRWGHMARVAGNTPLYCRQGIIDQLRKVNGEI